MTRRQRINSAFFIKKSTNAVFFYAKFAEKLQKRIGSSRVRPKTRADVPVALRCTGAGKSALYVIILILKNAVLSIGAAFTTPVATSKKIVVGVVTNPYTARKSAKRPKMSSVKIAVYPGSFDPITLGHLNVIERSSRLFDRLVVAVGVNSEKSPWFTAEERCELIRRSTQELGLTNVETTTYSGLTVRFAKELGARVIVRGVRPLTDIPAELTMMMANRRLEPEVETLFLIADGELAHVSSSLIKEIAGSEEERSLCAFLPQCVIEATLKKSKERRARQ